MKSQVLHTVGCTISAEAAGEIWHWSLLGVKGLRQLYSSWTDLKAPDQPSSSALSSEPGSFVGGCKFCHPPSFRTRPGSHLFMRCNTWTAFSTVSSAFSGHEHEARARGEGVGHEREGRAKGLGTFPYLLAHLAYRAWIEEERLGTRQIHGDILQSTIPAKRIKTLSYWKIIITPFPLCNTEKMR